ncbi:AraC family transcriptional regulator [Niabella ginsenosidivorans]|uniref:AraC family transcriptional regulator n=1 Tax=Niabella ginsenosidivorans TaxID=1176587 RepID=A0A1A9I0M1_9BACT|nr:AraC family transcriptional regulator [Niabella ginsenosidivorans]ANH80270.1 AraC family transcriptional regulator [Niabella ginsenosidivorans]
MEQTENKQGSFKNIWYGIGRRRIELPGQVLREKVLGDPLLNGLYISSLGYYPNAKAHFTKRKKGLHGNMLFYCVAGQGFYELRGETYAIKASEFFMLPCNEAHAYGSVDKDPWSIYWVHFDGKQLAALNKISAVTECFKPVHIKDNGEITGTFNKMYKFLELGYSLDNLYFSGLCLQQFISYFIYNGRHFPVIENKELDCVDRVILFMQEKLQESLTLTDLSRYSNYSVSRFSNLFKQKTGYAPMDYFMQMKIQQACQLLDFTDKAIKEVALTMGFDDPYYFSKRFKQVIGMPPQQYRAIKKD